MVRADRGYRLRWLLLLIGMAGVGAAALGWALPAWIARLETLEPDVALRSIGRLLAVMWLGYRRQWQPIQTCETVRQ